MVWNLDPGWLLIAFVVVGILSFILAMALHAIMGPDGFGAGGNAAIITTGFFLAVFAANNFGIRLADLRMAVAFGLGGAFVCLSALAMLKALLNRV